jgi:DNA-directed RNA polymerase subunit RPC12/RpoP
MNKQNTHTVKNCNWDFYCLAGPLGDSFYQCRVCKHKVLVKSYELVPTLSTQNECFKNDE